MEMKKYKYGVRNSKYEFLLDVKRKAKALGRFKLANISKELGLGNNNYKTVKSALDCLVALNVIAEEREKSKINYRWLNVGG